MSSFSNVSFAFFPTQMLSSGCLAFFVGSISHKHVENTLCADHFRVVTFVFCLPIFIWSQQSLIFITLTPPGDWIPLRFSASFFHMFFWWHLHFVSTSYKFSHGLNHQLSRRHRPRCAGDTPKKQIWSKSIHESFHMRIYIYIAIENDHLVRWFTMKNGDVP